MRHRPTMMIPPSFLLLALSSPSLSLAWCNSGISGGVRCALKSFHSNSGKKYQVSKQVPLTRRHSQLHRPLCSIADGDNLGASIEDTLPIKKRPSEDNHGSKHDEGDEINNNKLSLRKASELLSTFWSMASPYYKESQPGRRLFYGMILLTLLNSGVSVMFSYISKDFWNALSSKDVNEFYTMMVKFGGALIIGAPVAVLYR